MTYRSHTSRPHTTHRSPKNYFEQYFPWILWKFGWKFHSCSKIVVVYMYKGLLQKFRDSILSHFPRFLITWAAVIVKTVHIIYYVQLKFSKLRPKAGFWEKKSVYIIYRHLRKSKVEIFGRRNDQESFWRRKVATIEGRGGIQSGLAALKRRDSQDAEMRPDWKKKFGVQCTYMFFLCFKTFIPETKSPRQCCFCFLQQEMFQWGFVVVLWIWILILVG